MQRYVARVVTLGCFTALLGCNGDDTPPPPERASISGTVTLDEALLKSGTITFVPDPDRNNEGPSAVARIENGRYQLNQETGPMIGWNKVSITSEAVDEPPENGSSAPPPPSENTIPEQYNLKTKLDHDVKPGDNFNVDFELAS